MRRFSLFAVLLLSILGFSMNAFGQPAHQKSGLGEINHPPRFGNHSSLIRPRTPSPFSQPPLVRDASAFTTRSKAPKGAEADVPTIYGSLIFSYAWNLDDANPGIFSFPASAPISLNLVRDGYLTEANGGGTYANSRYYMYYFMEIQGVVFTYWRVFDTDTWECIFSERTADSYVTTDMTYDRTTETLYGCLYNFQSGAYYFGKINPDSGAVTAIAQWDTPLFTLAADVNGELYGIDYMGNFVTVGKKDGSIKVLGNTGVKPAYTQSMTFDFKTNRLYWAATTSNSTGLYEVDMSDYKARLIGYFDNQEEFAGLYIMNEGASAKAPGELEDFSIEYLTATENDITVSFTLPTETFDGTPLSGNLDWFIRINDADVDMGEAAPGTKVTKTVKGSTGYNIVTAFAQNSNGQGPEARIRKWIGKDSPVAVGNLKAEVVDNEVVLTWDAPTASQHDGYFDPATLKYVIYRSPNDVLVCEGTSATTFTDKTVSKDLLTAYRYRVVAYAGNLAGGEANSSQVLTGDPFVTPYREDFTNSNNWNLFTVLDINADGKTWYWEPGFAVGSYSMTGLGMDDWLFTPMMKLSANDFYRFVMNARTMGYSETFEVKIGKAPTPEAMTQTVIEKTKFLTYTVKEFVGEFMPDEDGVYYIGLHHMSPAECQSLRVADIELTKTASVFAPELPSDFKVTPGAKGALSATVTMKAPTTDLRGNKLDNISSVTLFKGTRMVKRFSDVKPGQELSYEDNAISEAGVVEYRAYATNDEGNGRSISGSAFIGPDVPGPANNIHVVQENGKAHLTWDAPTEGQNGGYIDPATLKYHVNAQDFNTGGTYTVGMNLTERELWDTPTFEGQQGMASYYVYAANDLGVGYGYRSNVAIMGKPYALPFNESFKGNNPTYDTWRFENTKGDSRWGIADSGSYPACVPADNDGGLVTFEPAEAYAECTFISGLIDISKTESPIYEFYYYFNRLSADKITAVVSTNGYEFIELGNTIDFEQESGQSGWRKLTVSLADYKSAGTVQVGISVVAGKDLANIHFDNIVVRDQPDKDLNLRTFVAPSVMKIGETATFTVEVENLGSLAADKYSVVLYREGKEVASIEGTTIQPYESKSFNFPQTAELSFGDKTSYSAEIVFDGDKNSSNNKSAAYTVNITQPTYPVIDDFNGVINESNNTAELSWSAPRLDEEIEVTDGFETYDSFIINRIGDWATVDRDQNYTVYVANAAMWPNAGERQSFIVFNAEKAGLADPYNDGTPSMFLAHDSDQMLICFSGDDDTVANDDWLLSPRLSGKAQTISFYVKSLTDYYGQETYEFYTSKGELRENLSEFVKVNNVGGHPTEEWTKVTVNLPAGTNYFAIRCVSMCAMGFCIDDVTYVPATEPVVLQGYNVYCNDVKLNSSVLKETSYKHAGVDPKGAYHYNVTCVYDKGESAYSNTVVLGELGVEDGVAESVKVFTYGNRLYIQGASGKAYSVTGLQGINVANGTASDVTAIVLENGIYVVTVGDYRCKVIVK